MTAQTANEYIVEGPAMAKSLESVNEKKLKKVLKEGGKRGVEIEGAADMGGLKFFCCKVDEPEGNVDLLVETVKAMNAQSDPSEEERRGGSGAVGKMVLSQTDEKLAMVTYVPKNMSGECGAEEWARFIITDILGQELAGKHCAFTPCEGVDPANYFTCVVTRDGDAGVFPLKMREDCISRAYNFLRSRDLFPKDDESDDEDYVFGDEDFPEFDEEAAAAPAAETYDLLEPMAERLGTDKLAKKMKKVLKEGGKRGVEIEGAADMGGLKYFCTMMIEPAGDMDCLVECMRAMNVDCAPDEEERRGCSGKIGKIIISHSDDKVNVVAYVPKDETENCSASEWLQYVTERLLETGNGIKDIPGVAKGLVLSYPGNEKTFAKATLVKDADQGLFPLKIKDAAINSAYTYLRSKGLFPEDDEDDDDEMVWGDEDFGDI